MGPGLDSGSASPAMMKLDFPPEAYFVFQIQ